jgi:hypothetical protein
MSDAHVVDELQAFLERLEENHRKIQEVIERMTKRASQDGNRDA